MNKTNAIRILEKLNIPFSTLEYEENEEHIPGHGLARATAEKTGMPAERIFKTIVMRSDAGEILVFCVQAEHEVNLKKARQASGVKELSPLKAAELPAATGYVRGGCSPIGMKKTFRTFLDENAYLYDTIFISAGVRGLQLEISPDNLLRAVPAEICAIT